MASAPVRRGVAVEGSKSMAKAKKKAPTSKFVGKQTDSLATEIIQKSNAATSKKYRMAKR